MASLSHLFHKKEDPLVSALLQVKLRFRELSVNPGGLILEPALLTPFHTNYAPHPPRGMKFGKQWPRVKNQQWQLMFTAYSPPLISPIQSISHTCSLNPPKGTSFIVQIFAKGLLCARSREHCGGHHPYLDGPQGRMDVELQTGVNFYTGKDQGNV